MNPLQFSDKTITDGMNAYLDSVTLSRSENTARTYHNAMTFFRMVLIENGVEPDDVPIQKLKEDAIVWLASALKDYAPTSERLYLTAASGLYEYIAAENLADINLPRIKLLIQQRARRPGQRLPQFPRESIEEVLDYADKIIQMPHEDKQERLRALRDRAFLLTLADSGLRVHEACGLRRGDIDWNEGRAIIIGKGNRQAVVRFSSHSMDAMKVYLSARSELDGSSGRPLHALPLFARHDKGAGKKIKPITTTTGRNIVAERVSEALGIEAVGTITPHSFRHYFVTVVLRASGNLKLAQELARHKNIAVTQRYAHLSDDELDRGYYDIFEKKA
ncbi:MAG: tyrosine-type recombinase/integrase [Anaerolineaceae bacterium]|nr:tyrosine-type recombinase/integrase [Anaerolineaceae bacterium]MBN2677648.1 tyrosine-type recombinase/integrase [Anaerolineaceae bacterium]